MDPAGWSELEHYRREAMGAFAHEVRTPLTSIRMVLELARRQAQGENLLLDPELADMLRQSVDDLQNLADDLQEASRLERGRMTIGHGPADLAIAIEAARELLDSAIQLDGPPVDQLEGPWDAPRLVRAIAGFAESANRIGDGSGHVTLHVGVSDRAVTIQFESGVQGDILRTIGSEAGFGFFRSRQFVLAMGGSVDYTRSERYARFLVSLPRVRA